jgi:hypothetical protein
MTARFPLACKGKYDSPYGFDATHTDGEKLCLKIRAMNCPTDKCLYEQTAVRKLMISVVQDPLCGWKQQREGPYSGRSPYSVEFKTPSGQSLIGVTAVWFWHTYNGITQVAIDILRSVPFITSPNAPNLTGYELCILGRNISTCALDSGNKVRIATYDVGDHTCDSGQLAQF